MHQSVVHAATVFMGFFAIMNPVANTPIFISLTRDDDRATKHAIARNALLLTFAIVVVFCLEGNYIFQLFGITLPAFRITGGLLVFLIGFHMLQGSGSAVHTPSDEDQEQSRQAKLSVAVSPLAIPLLAGPGTIATAMNFAAPGDAVNVSITIGAFFLLCLITYLFFLFGAKLIAYIGRAAINAMTRLMGLILAVIGTQLVVNGITGVVEAMK